MSEQLTTRFRVDGMDCASCAAKVSTAAKGVEGVQVATVSVQAGTMVLKHTGKADLKAVARRVINLGYAVRPAGASRSPRPKAHSHDHDQRDHGHDHDGHDHSKEDGAARAGLYGQPTPGPWWKSRKALLTIASGTAVAAAWIVGRAIPSLDPYAFTLAMLVGFIPIAWRAATGVRYGTPFSIETLMTIAAVGAVIIGAAEEAAIVVFLFLIGELLEGEAAGRARASIQALTKLVPQTARLEENGQATEVPAETLQIGATIILRPGDRTPADGEIIEGASTIDESPLTGESVPVRRQQGDKALAGTINGDGVLRIRVTAAAADNTIARVVRLVEEAQESKAPTERFIDRFARWYTPGVLVVGFLVAVVPPLLWSASWSEWIYKGLALLLIGCPCALVISVPAAIAAALSAGARRGLLMKGGAVLEGLGKITAVALDKTGTLTAGKPQVTDIVTRGVGEREALSLAAALESGSSHPLAVAILAKAQTDKAPVPPASDGKAVGGKGVAGRVGGKDVFLGSPSAALEQVELSASDQDEIARLNDAGKTVSVLIVNRALAAFIAMRDEPRPDAEEGLRALTSFGIKTMMLTGDNRRTGEAIGKRLGIEVRAELLPEDKQRIVGELQNQGLVVAKVGDGINDAPALAAADIGIAMGGGTDVALETADAAVLHGRVADIAAMVALSKVTLSNIWQNITIALGLKGVFLVTTILGITGLWPAILADTGATVLVTANALRLLAYKPAGVTTGNV
ncbi:MAG: cadmium-translocating P-type ATPase [Mesorhizobium sp.]|uniref:heavy metal translocating P-type ATPase n=1 Tax=Mesorhizobium sp. TaxID=1871066 RepID=UPI000FE4AEB6|nr:heavy metal translocating P-type ATPase [Mesorhizobium sp.]RWA75268.1 MAG: cadmium-translocating P-type ATPase [Mesorhizobium sp.]